MCKLKPKKTITGVYGGSFNPIHLGHTSMARGLVGRNLIDELWLVVSPQNPLKNNDLWDDQLRLQLAQTAIMDIEHVEVSDIEFHLPKPNYMLTTLQTLSDRHPDREFVLIIGMDNWECFHRWYKSDIILSNYHVMVLPRDTSETTQPGCPQHNLPQDNVQFIQLPLINLSSTWIRTQISGNPSYDGEGLDPKVWQTIKQHRK